MNVLYSNKSSCAVYLISNIIKFTAYTLQCIFRFIFLHAKLLIEILADSVQYVYILDIKINIIIYIIVYHTYIMYI